MFHAVSFALIDSVNVLLIGIIFAVGVLLPAGGAYKKVVMLLVFGAWVGVVAAAIPVYWLLSSIQDRVARALDSPVFGVLLIGAGLLGMVLTWRGGGSSPVGKLLGPLRQPGLLTWGTGVVLGAVQSLTSAPFYAGLAYLATVELNVSLEVTAVFLYATLALSLPILVAVLVGVVRRYPASAWGRGFVWARLHAPALGVAAGYFVGALLIALGILHL